MSLETALGKLYELGNALKKWHVTTGGILVYFGFKLRYLQRVGGYGCEVQPH